MFMKANGLIQTSPAKGAARYFYASASVTNLTRSRPGGSVEIDLPSEFSLQGGANIYYVALSFWRTLSAKVKSFKEILTKSPGQPQFFAALQQSKLGNRPTAIVWAYWREVLCIPEDALLLVPEYVEVSNGRA